MLQIAMLAWCLRFGQVAPDATTAEHMPCLLPTEAFINADWVLLGWRERASYPCWLHIESAACWLSVDSMRSCAAGGGASPQRWERHCRGSRTLHLPACMLPVVVLGRIARVCASWRAPRACCWSSQSPRSGMSAWWCPAAPQRRHHVQSAVRTGAWQLLKQRPWRLLHR